MIEVHQNTAHIVRDFVHPTSRSNLEQHLPYFRSLCSKISHAIVWAVQAEKQAAATALRRRIRHVRCIRLNCALLRYNLLLMQGNIKNTYSLILPRTGLGYIYNLREREIGQEREPTSKTLPAVPQAKVARRDTRIGASCLLY